MRPALLVVALASVAACGTSNAVLPDAKLPSDFVTKCNAREPDDRPLVVAWPSTEKATLESQRKQGLVAVRYLGCEMRVLTQCTLPGKYAYSSITRKRDHVDAHNDDELVARIPIGAASLKGEMQQHGAVNVDMTIVGRFEADRKVYRKDDLEGDCNEATHLVSALTVGAFDFGSAADSTVGGTAGLTNGPGIGSTSHAARNTSSGDGDAKACEKSTDDDVKPPSSCGAVLRLELLALKDATARCGVGLEWDGQGCVRTSEGARVQCPEGTKFDGKACIAKVHTECLAAMHFEPGKGCVQDASKDATRELNSE